MDWYVMRHPEIDGAAVVAETALEHHRGRGWLRVSDALGDDARDFINLASYADAADLDAEAAPSVPAKSTKEK